MKKTEKNIALFGGSFNPPHFGHLEACRFLLAQEVFDEIWFLPVYRHPFNKKLIAYKHRLAMLQLLIKEWEDNRVQICEIEKDLDQIPNYTFDTVQALTQKHPQYNFHIAIGSDVNKELSQWHKIENLKKIVSFFFIPRQGYEKSTLPEISSSQIRDHLTQKKDITHLTTTAIANYILQNRLQKDL